jgi:SagB-type dehydrogenase family enzyme
MTDLADASPYEQADPFEQSRVIEQDLMELAERHGLPSGDVVDSVLALLTTLTAMPKAVFDEYPEYRRELAAAPALALGDHPVTSTHGFFDVVKSRASRRDFGTGPLDGPRLVALLHWTFGIRGTALAYDFRDTPLRFAPSAGGLASVDAYVITGDVDGLEPGSYYFDAERGLVPLVEGIMLPNLAGLRSGQEWLSESSALVVLVSNSGRVKVKYGSMAPKLALLDAGVALGHLELVAAALELRATILGGLPADELRKALRLTETDRVPLASIAIGTRPGGHGSTQGNGHSHG